ncbi:MAG: hypothetical protein HY313_07935 [Acidobacteria bacterium]|nr:hypothetical protein [Acidobacteriota bacterium]
MEPNPNLMAFASRLLPPVTRVISLFIPGRDSRIAWRNAKNNAEIIQLVAHVSSILPPPGSGVSLTELVPKCYALGSFPALWAIEGLGHYYADSFYERGEIPKNVLTDPKLFALPSSSLLMLHAGIGMSFAKRNLQGLNPQSPASAVRKAVENIVALCKDSSQEGYFGAAIESLGLTARFLHGLSMVRVIDEQLAALDQTLVGYLWHGAGRAVYFSPPNFIPGYRSPWRAVQMCRLEAPHDLGRRNMVAGFAWAVTLVNMRFPVIMETLLQYHGQEFSEDDAFSNGVMSSVIMRYDTTPDDPHIVRFYQYKPAAVDQKIAALWERLVQMPCKQALQHLGPVIKDHRRIGEVFHYQDLSALIERLKKAESESRATR